MNFFYPIKLPYQKMHVLFYLIFGKYYNFSNLYGNPYRNVIIWLIWEEGANPRRFYFLFTFKKEGKDQCWKSI